MRYRIHFDVCEEEGGIVSAGLLNELIAAAKSAAKIAIPQEKARKVKIDPSSGSWHAHYGDRSGTGCATCQIFAVDGFTQDVTTVFPVRPTA